MCTWSEGTAHSCTSPIGWRNPCLSHALSGCRTHAHSIWEIIVGCGRAGPQQNLSLCHTHIHHTRWHQAHFGCSVLSDCSFHVHCLYKNFLVFFFVVNKEMVRVLTVASERFWQIQTSLLWELRTVVPQFFVPICLGTTDSPHALLTSVCSSVTFSSLLLIKCIIFCRK